MPTKIFDPQWLKYETTGLLPHHLEDISKALHPRSLAVPAGNNQENEGIRSDLIKTRRRLFSNLENARNNSPKKQISAADAALRNFDRKHPSVKEWIN